MQLEHAINTVPNPTGIRAEIEPVSKYPQIPKAINTIEFIKLDLCAFILNYLILINKTIYKTYLIFINCE